MRSSFCLFLLCISWTSSVSAEINSSILSAQNAQQAIVGVRATSHGPVNDKGKMRVHYREGAGALIDHNGILATNLHTLKNMNRIEVRFVNGSTYLGKIVHLAPAFDLAFVKVPTHATYTPVPLGRSEMIHLNQEVINAGQSHWRKNTLAAGRVVGLGKNKTDHQLDVFEVNMEMYVGDSGGPILNKEGRLLGIMTAKRNTKNNSSFAIPVDKIIASYAEYKKGQKKQ